MIVSGSWSLMAAAAAIPFPGDGLAHDAQERLASRRRYVDALIEIELQRQAASLGDLARDLREDGCQRLVQLPRERRDRPPRLAESPLGRGRDLGSLPERCGLALAEPAALGHDERKLLRKSVVQLARDPPPLLRHSGRGHAAPVVPDFSRRADEDREVERQTENVTGVDPVRVQRGKQQVVDPREGSEGGAGGEPARQLVARPRGAARKANRGRGEQHNRHALRTENCGMTDDQRPPGRRRRESGIDPGRQPFPERARGDRDGYEHPQAAQERRRDGPSRPANPPLAGESRHDERPRAEQPRGQRRPGREAAPVQARRHVGQRRQEEVGNTEDRQCADQRQVAGSRALAKTTEDQVRSQHPDHARQRLQKQMQRRAAIRESCERENRHQQR